MIKTTAAENKKIRGELLIMREKWAKRKNEEMTLRELYDEYMAEYAPNCLKPSTITIYQTNLRNHILGKYLLHDLQALFFHNYYILQNRNIHFRYHLLLCLILHPFPFLS